MTGRPKGSGVTPPIQRFIAELNRTSDCWLWIGCIHKPSGYAKFFTHKDDQGRTRLVYAHRWSYEWFVGPIPDGLDLDHLCRVRHCVNPKHLEPVTRAENLARRPELPPQNRPKAERL